MKRLVLASFALLAMVAVASCETVEDREPSFSYIHAAILRPNCATSSCHTNLGASVIGPSAAGIQFDKREGSYLFLTGNGCDTSEVEGDPPRNFVVPFEPESSKLMYQLRGIEVRRMPPDVPLPEGEIELIEQWILAGAPCN